MRWWSFFIRSRGLATGLALAFGCFVPGLAVGQVTGEELVADLGCAACHEGLPDPDRIRTLAPAFGAGDRAYAPAYIFHYLADPQPVRTDIGPARMPTFDLSARQRLALASYLATEPVPADVDAEFGAAQSANPDADEALGERLFRTFGCGSCHTHPDVPADRLAPNLAGEGDRVLDTWLTDYLSDPVPIRPAGPRPGEGGQMPDFRLTEQEVELVAEYLMSQRSLDLPAFAPQDLSPFSMMKAEALLTDQWSCLGCHALGADGGRIGPPLNGIGQRLNPAFVRAVMENPSHAAPGSVMPASLEQPDRLDLMASFLVAREGAWEPASHVEGLLAPAPDAPGAAAGAGLYRTLCATCHGSEGRGDGFNAAFLPVAPTNHADSAAMAERPDDTLFDGIYAGARILGKSHRMPGFGASLSHEQIRAVVAYIRTLCRCEGPEWSRDGRRGR